MRRSPLLLCVLVAVLLFASCREHNKATSIKIVCTSDVHGCLFPYDFLTGDSLRGSLAHVSSFLKEQRQQGIPIVYVDNGDVLQGTPATYCYNTNAVGLPHVASEVMNYLQCDAAVLGNRDIELGGPTYQRYRNDLACDVLGGNILYENTKSPFALPYTIVERAGLQIAILGLTTPAIPHWVPRSQWSGLWFDEMEIAASRWMQHLKAITNPDLVIGLFHSGYEGGIITDNYAENVTRKVAELVPGFDAIFYGHDHQPRIAEVVNVAGDTVLLLNPGCDVMQVATLDITLTEEGKFVLGPSLVNMEDYLPDSEFLAEFSSQIERIDKYVDYTVATSTCFVPMSDALYGSSAFVDFIHQLQLDATGAKVSFAAPSVIDGAMPEGEVKVGDIYHLYPSENYLCVLWLTGREIKSYLEMSYDRWIAQRDAPTDYQYFDSAAGIIYDVYTTQPQGSRVDIKCMADGSPFDMDTRYMVVMNSCRVHGGDGLMAEGVGITHDELLHRIVYSTTFDLRFYMINTMEMRKVVTLRPFNHWRFVPGL